MDNFAIFEYSRIITFFQIPQVGAQLSQFDRSKIFLKGPELSKH